jgi:hypothetical protein
VVSSKLPEAFSFLVWVSVRKRLRAATLSSVSNFNAKQRALIREPNWLSSGRRMSNERPNSNARAEEIVGSECMKRCTYTTRKGTVLPQLEMEKAFLR